MTSVNMVRYILKKEGFQGLYRGLPGIWVKDVPGSFIYFGSYEAAKYTMRQLSETEHLGKYWSVGAAAQHLAIMALLADNVGSRDHCLPVRCGLNLSFGTAVCWATFGEPGIGSGSPRVRWINKEHLLNDDDQSSSWVTVWFWWIIVCPKLKYPKTLDRLSFVVNYRVSQN